MAKRKFLPWELNHLRRHGFADIDLEKIGEKPVEYVTGHAQFYGQDFLVSPDVLIPRIETEKTVDYAFLLAEKLPPDKFLRFADIGCGSGAIGITLADRLDQAGYRFNFFLSDISPAALKIAQANIDRLIPHLKNSLTLLESDLLSDYPAGIKFDGLIANLPYVPTGRLAHLEPSVIEHEPHLALKGGPKGTSLINRLLDRSASHLEPSAFIVLEIDHHQKLAGFNIPPGFEAKIDLDDYHKNRYLILTTAKL